ncbi:TPR_REGION domain-containing protein [Candidatus Nitrotoga sp. HW29]|uniref:glycosyltransferase n=1 Tax=Candidatus Nitrotoga sp. HW29 TaxID=2886963 RepID=UPI001EF2E0D4|nr:glycosyltransferase [Candidatus Nitrotoga sp. HW29]CAH1906403.1 TPR_REGION domain-containing protein [Candidatus Nitrotoga sp. HW29]
MYPDNQPTLPLVSVIVRSMGRPELRLALESIARQDYPNVEVIVVDATGGSHPALPAITWQSGHSIRIVGGHRRLPRPQAANEGLQAVNGEWLCFLDDDDTYDFDFLSAMLSASHAHPEALLVYGRTRIFDENGKVEKLFGSPFNRALMYFGPLFYWQSAIIRSKVIELGCRFDETLEICEDRDFLNQIAEHSDFVFVPVVGFNYHPYLGTSGTGSAATRDVSRLERSENILRLKWSGASSFHTRRLVEMCMGAVRAFHDGNFALSRTLFSKTLVAYPDDPSALHGLARLDLHEGQLATAEKLVRRAIEINPSVDEFRMTMALILEASHKYEEALAFARQAGINPTFQAAADALARRLPVTARATPPAQSAATGVQQPGRLAPCPCGSGHRFKECCGAIRPNQEPAMVKANLNARVTIVMTIRERYSLTIQSLKSILSNTPPIFRLIFVDYQSPIWIRKQLETLAHQYGIELVDTEDSLWPNQARIKTLDRISSEYTVFIDNDVEVEPGWLEKLIACADETGAGIVGPLYLWSDGKSVPKIHMAGGRINFYHDVCSDGLVMELEHLLINHRPEDVPEQLFRKPWDFVEYHCMLVRTRLLLEHGLLDDKIISVNDHVDVSLAAKRLGYSTYMEPASRVNYLAFADFLLGDLPIFRLRWSREAGEQCILHFAKKWGVCNDQRSFGVLRTFLSKHVGHIDPLRANIPPRQEWNTTMRKEELQQTRSGLLDMAIDHGYQAAEISLLSTAYFTAQALMTGRYRSCGRPFINHLAGTASVLLRYDFRIEVVMAGLLHAAYTHCPAHPEGKQAAREDICSKLGGEGNKVERLVRSYTLRGMKSPKSQAILTDADRITISDAEVQMIALANEVDMYLSGETRYSAPRNDEMTPAQLDMADKICEIIGVSGMSRSLQQEHNDHRLPPPLSLLTKQAVSYQLNQEHSAITPSLTTPNSLNNFN